MDREEFYEWCVNNVDKMNLMSKKYLEAELKPDRGETAAPAAAPGPGPEAGTTTGTAAEPAPEPEPEPKPEAGGEPEAEAAAEPAALKPPPPLPPTDTRAAVRMQFGLSRGSKKMDKEKALEIEARELFNEVDVDKSELLEKEEVAQLAANLGFMLTVAELNAAMVRGAPTTWTVFQQDGPNHLGF